MPSNELGRRLVACKRWRWMPGMQILDAVGEPYRIKWVNGDSLECDDDDRIGMPYFGIVPDLTDPATVGCVLQLVREAWGDDHIVALNIHPPVQIYHRHRALEAWAEGLPYATVWDSNGIPTEMEALVTALEEAPCR